MSWYPTENVQVITVAGIKPAFDQRGESGRNGETWKVTVRVEGEDQAQVWFVSKKGGEHSAVVSAGLRAGGKYSIHKEATGEFYPRGARITRLVIEPHVGVEPVGNGRGPQPVGRPSAVGAGIDGEAALRRLAIGDDGTDGVYVEFLETAKAILDAALGAPAVTPQTQAAAAGQLVQAWIQLGCPRTPREAALDAVRRAVDSSGAGRQAEIRVEREPRRSRDDDDEAPF